MTTGTEETSSKVPDQPSESARSEAGPAGGATDLSSGNKTAIPTVQIQSHTEAASNAPDASPSQSTKQPADGSVPAAAAGATGTQVTPEQLKALTNSLEASKLHSLRIANFAYVPFSLPASRTASHEDDSHRPSRQETPSSTSDAQSPQLSSKGHEVQSPPLTPSGTAALGDAEAPSPRIPADAAGSGTSRHGMITPQESSQDPSPQSSASKAKFASHRPASSGDAGPRRPVSSSDIHDHVLLGDHRKGLFSIGPGGGSGSGGGGGGSLGSGSGSTPGGSSLPVSRDSSPSRHHPAASQFYTRPFTPSGDANDPYAADKRRPMNKIEPRFVFSKLSRKKDTSPSSPSASSLRGRDEKRHSGFFGAGHHHNSSSISIKKSDSGPHDENRSPTTYSHQGSMSDLKRFFKLGASHHHKIKRAVSPAVSVRSSRTVASKSHVQIPFGDEHSLTSKYGKLGKVLGSGAGGSVRLMKRSEDNTVFAVKEFRQRHPHETEKEYVKKVTAEYCIGSSLHNGNIIETLDIIREKNKWYEVMEYAPFDLFAIVMTGRMTRPEIACCFLQILSGLTYLHSMGLAHRDLKLDNVVVSQYGIMKIIDFGSAHVFQYPFESGIVLASGIVGSDPYLAPEVYDERKYDPTAVDIWSLAIIFCCMTLRRFPWKVPRMTDNSYKLFASEPSPGHDPKRLALHPHKSPSDHAKHAEEHHAAEKTEDAKQEEDGKKADAAPKEQHAVGDGPGEKTEAADETAGEKTDGKAPATAETAEKPAEKKEVIKGPWRILRLLPRETRHVIGAMLAIDPKERIKMKDILKDPWVANTIICRQMEQGQVIRSNTHTHVLEPPTQPPAS